MTPKPLFDRRSGALGAARLARRCNVSVDSWRRAWATRASLSEAISSKKPLMEFSGSSATRREFPQSPQPLLGPPAADGRSRRIYSRLDGRRTAGDEKGQPALQRQGRKMRTAIAAREYVEQA